MKMIKIRATLLLLAVCLSCPLGWAATSSTTTKIPAAEAGIGTDQDTDKDGLPDALEERIKTDPVLADTDGDGIKDGLEVGKDRDKPLNTDKDRRINALDIDDDGDGIPTAAESSDDSDKDGSPDYLDNDADGDGILDAQEGGLTGLDHDRDGVDDHYDVDKTDGKDKNGDGIDDQAGLPDKDGDKLPDARTPTPTQVAVKSTQPDPVIEVEVAENTKEISMVVKSPADSAPLPVLASGVRDTDGDGMPDELELGLDTDDPVDTDSDGIFDFLDEDDDGDQVPTRIEGEADRDGDGRVNYLDKDASGYFYCATDGRIVEGIRKFRVTPEKGVTLHQDAKQGRYRWHAKKAGVYTLQFILPKQMRTLTTLEKGELYVTRASGLLLNLGWGEDIGKAGYLAKFTPGKLPVWYSSFNIQLGAPLMVNHNIPLVGGACGELPSEPTVDELPE